MTTFHMQLTRSKNVIYMHVRSSFQCVLHPHSPSLRESTYSPFFTRQRVLKINSASRIHVIAYVLSLHIEYLCSEDY